MDKNRFLPVRQIGGRHTEKMSVVLDRKLNEKRLMVKMSRQKAGELLPVLKNLRSKHMPDFLDLEERREECIFLFRFEDGTSLEEKMEDASAGTEEIFAWIGGAAELSRQLWEWEYPLEISGFDLDSIYVLADQSLCFTDFSSLIRAGGDERKVIIQLWDMTVRLLGKHPLGKEAGDDFWIRLLRQHGERRGSIRGFLKDLDLLKTILKWKGRFRKHRKMIRRGSILAGVTIGLFLLLFSGERDRTFEENEVLSGEAEIGVSGNTVSENSVSETGIGREEMPDPENEDWTVLQHHEEARRLMQSQESVRNALQKARDHLLAAQNEIDHMEEEEQMECRIENLSMLSIIYKLLGKKDLANRTSYYEQSVECIREFLAIEGVEESESYRARLSDLVELKEEMGEHEEAIGYLEKWEEEHPDSGKEFYFTHAFLLMKCPGKEREMESLKEKMEQIAEVREDFRYAQVEKMISNYIKGEDAYAYETEES